MSEKQEYLQAQLDSLAKIIETEYYWEDFQYDGNRLQISPSIYNPHQSLIHMTSLLLSSTITMYWEIEEDYKKEDAHIFAFEMYEPKETRYTTSQGHCEPSYEKKTYPISLKGIMIHIKNTLWKRDISYEELEIELVAMREQLKPYSVYFMYLAKDNVKYGTKGDPQKPTLYFKGVNKKEEDMSYILVRGYNPYEQKHKWYLKYYSKGSYYPISYSGDVTIEKVIAVFNPLSNAEIQYRDETSLLKLIPNIEKRLMNFPNYSSLEWMGLREQADELKVIYLFGNTKIEIIVGLGRNHRWDDQELFAFNATTYIKIEDKIIATTEEGSHLSSRTLFSNISRLSRIKPRISKYVLELSESEKDRLLEILEKASNSDYYEICTDQEVDLYTNLIRKKKEAKR